MQSVSSRIWTRVAVSISYDDNHYIMGTSIVSIFLSQPLYIYACVCVCVCVSVCEYVCMYSYTRNFPET